MFNRLELLINDKIELIKNKTVLIIGLGGVGGYALESIVRSGIGKVIIVDYDVIDITNLNRQIISLHSNIDEKKIDVAKKRALDIYPELNINAQDMFLDSSNIETLNKYDYIIINYSYIFNSKSN